VAAGLGPLLVAAGVTPLYDSLVRFPLRNYPQFHQHMVWGGGVLPAFATIALVASCLPALIPVALARGVLGLWRRRPVATWRPLLVSGLLAATTTAAMWYFPDFVHLALALPLTLPLAAEAVQRLLTLLGNRRLLGAALLTPITAGVAWLLADNLVLRRGWFSLPRDTAFGRVDFSNVAEAQAMEIIARGLDTAERREAFAYPYGASLYLVANATNPTRFQFVNPRYSDPAQIDEVMRILEERKVPYVLVAALSLEGKRDAILQYLVRAYERVPLVGAGSSSFLFAVFKRRPDGRREASAPAVAPGRSVE
jgi:hypothetical protein